MFIKEANAEINAAEKEIEAAMYLVEDPDTKNKLQLEMKINKADGMLEQLCEKLSRGTRFDNADLNDEVIEKMHQYMEEYKQKEEKLKYVLIELKSYKAAKQPLNP